MFTAVRHVLEVKSHKPCVLHGISGSGKTSVMAMLARTAKSIVPGDVVCILRFLGTSSLSSSIRDTLLSVCQQVNPVEAFEWGWHCLCKFEVCFLYSISK